MTQERIDNKPISSTIVRTTKEVRITLHPDEITKALTEYLCRYYAEFRNMHIDFDFVGDDGSECECIALREEEKRK